jgi:hypothetical protein
MDFAAEILVFHLGDELAFEVFLDGDRTGFEKGCHVTRESTPRAAPRQALRLRTNP